MIKLSFSCTEDYNEMAKDECGRFCASCQHNVYDFRGKSQKEIRSILKADPSIKCGAFTKSQAEEEPRAKVNMIFRWAFAAVFVLGFNVNTLFGQDTKNCSTSHPEVKIVLVENSTIQITGTVFEQDSIPIAGARIAYKIDNGENNVAISDENGEFTIDLADDQFGKKINLYISGSYYMTQKVTIEALEVKKYVIKANLVEEEMLLGVMIIDE